MARWWLLTVNRFTADGDCDRIFLVIRRGEPLTLSHTTPRRTARRRLQSHCRGLFIDLSGLRLRLLRLARLGGRLTMLNLGALREAATDEARARASSVAREARKMERHQSLPLYEEGGGYRKARV